MELVVIMQILIIFKAFSTISKQKQIFLGWLLLASGQWTASLGPVIPPNDGGVSNPRPHWDYWGTVVCTQLVGMDSPAKCT